MKTVNRDRIGVVIVAYGEGKKINSLLDILQNEKKPGDKLTLIDNHGEHATAKVAESHPAVDIVIKSENVGFAAGCNKAASTIYKDVELLLFLNPDSRPEKGAITKLRKSPPDDWAAWMGLLVLADGKKVNTAGNVVHISGLSWVSGYGDRVDQYTKRTEVSIVSGADLMIRTKIWQRLGGFPPLYFMYYEDTELSVQLRMIGCKIGLIPDARIRHDYNFYNSDTKWLYLERNRYIFILRTWPLGLILVLLPLLVVVEIGLWVVSILQRRLLLKIRSTIMFIRVCPDVIKSRKKIQANNTLSNLEFLDMLKPIIDTPLLNSALRSKTINYVFIAYYNIARRILMAFSVTS